MAAVPGLARRRIDRAARALPLPDPGGPRMVEAARTVGRLQAAIYDSTATDLAAGRIVLFGQELDFGGPDRIDWLLAGAGTEAELKRLTLSYLGFVVPFLARGRSSDMEDVARLVRGFDAGCRFDAPGALRAGWNPYGASHRLINLLAGLALYRANGGEPAAGAEREILEHVRLCAAFVRRNLERDLGYNHLMKNLTALAVFAAAGSATPAYLTAPLDRDLPGVLENIVLADGGHAERSPMYHLLALLDVMVLRDCAGPGPGRGTLDELVRRMTDALGAMTHPDGGIALFNDAWLGEAPDAATLTGQASRTEPVARLAETGYVRLGDGPDAVLFDCGPCGPDDNPAHAHADFLSIEASIAARRFIVDPGVAAYEAGALRTRTRSAASHNGPHLGGVEPAEFWQSFRVGRRGRGYEVRDPALDGMAPLWCAGRQDGYAHVGCGVRRYVGLWPGVALLVCDLWTGPTDFLEASHFLIPNEWVSGPWAAGGAAPEFASSAAPGLKVRLATPAGHILNVESAAYYERFAAARGARRVVLQPATRGDLRGAALWCGWGADAEPPEAAAVKSLIERLGAAA